MLTEDNAHWCSHQERALVAVFLIGRKKNFQILTGAPANMTQKIEHPGWLASYKFKLSYRPLVVGMLENAALKLVLRTIECLSLRK